MDRTACVSSSARSARRSRPAGARLIDQTIEVHGPRARERVAALREKHPEVSDDGIADLLIRDAASRASSVGAAVALPGVIPGPGTRTFRRTLGSRRPLALPRAGQARSRDRRGLRLRPRGPCCPDPGGRGFFRPRRGDRPDRQHRDAVPDYVIAPPRLAAASLGAGPLPGKCRAARRRRDATRRLLPPAAALWDSDRRAGKRRLHDGGGNSRLATGIIRQRPFPLP